MRVPRLYPLSVLTAALLVSCGGGDTSGPKLLELIKWSPSGENQTDTVGQQLPLAIRVMVTLDSQPAEGYTVHFSGGNLGTVDMVTGPDGIATSSWTLGTHVGTQTVQASVTGASHSPQVFHATAVHDTAALFVKLSGDSQIVTNSGSLQQMIVKVTDVYGNPVAGRWVHFTKSGPVIIGADSIISLDDGKVTLNVSPGNVPNPFQVTATAALPLTGSPIQFNGHVVGAIATVNVGQSGNFFAPTNAIINAGEAVKFVWVGGTHSVTPDSAMGFSDTQLQIAPFTVGPIIFNTPGVYAFHCSAHGSSNGTGMAGTITVN